MHPLCPRDRDVEPPARPLTPARLSTRSFMAQLSGAAITVYISPLVSTRHHSFIVLCSEQYPLSSPFVSLCAQSVSEFLWWRGGGVLPTLILIQITEFDLPPVRQQPRTSTAFQTQSAAAGALMMVTFYILDSHCGSAKKGRQNQTSERA